MYWKQIRIYFLILTFSTGLLVSVIIILFPGLINPKTKPFVFPEVVPLPNWQKISSNSLPLNPEKSQNLLSQRKYQYIKNELSLDIEMRYLHNLSNADVSSFISNIDKIDAQSSSMIRYQKGVGYYGVGVGKQRVYLSSCINPRGGSTFTHAQYRQNRYLEDISFARLLPVLQGQEELIDKRCLWTHLSIPLQNSSPESSYQILEQVWFSWYKWWQPRFPQP